MPTAFVFDYNPESAEGRAETIDRALSAAGAEGWRVQATTSRNALLAKIAALGVVAQRHIALIDLYDGESDRGEQSGHRTIATIGSNPRLRHLCAACACTIYPHAELFESMANWGGAALIDAGAARQAKPSVLGSFLLELSSQPQLELIQWPGGERAAAREDELAVLRHVLGSPGAPAWQTAAVAMMAGGLENAQIARQLIATGEVDISAASVENGLSKLRKLIAEAAPGEGETQAAGTVYSRIAAQAPLPNDTRQLPDLSVLQKLVTSRLVRQAAWLTANQLKLLSALNTRLAGRQSQAGARRAGAAEEQLGEAALEIADRYGISHQSVWRMTKFGMFCAADAIADYVRHPQVELAHRLSALEREQGFVNWRREHSGSSLRLLEEPEIAIDGLGKLTVLGLTGEEWESARRTPPAQAVEVVAGLEGGIAKLLRGGGRKNHSTHSPPGP